MKIGLLASITVSSMVALVNAGASPFTYELSFDGGGSSASGQVVVDGGVATSGFLTITAGPAQGTYDLYVWNGGGVSSIRVNGGTDLIVDNVVNPNTDPFLDTYGLAFVSSTYSGGYPSEGIDFSLLSGTTYNLGGFGSGGWYVPNANGSATLTLIPEPGMAIGSLGLGLLSLAAFARYRSAFVFV